MRNKIAYFCFILLFFAVCIVPSAGMLVFGEAEARANEVLTPRPVLRLPDGSWNEAIATDLTNYFADRFAGRQQFITAYAKIQAALFAQSPEDSVILGKDGWLFYGDTLEDYLHENTLSDRNIQGICRTLELMGEYAQGQGTDFVFTVAPNKNSMEANGAYMPNVGEPCDTPKNLELLEYALKERRVTYGALSPVLEAEGLYYRLDSHWNMPGAALAFEEIAPMLGKVPYPWSKEPYTLQYTQKGDLYEMLYPAGKEQEAVMEFQRPFAFTYLMQEGTEPFEEAVRSETAYGDEAAPPPDTILLETAKAGEKGTLLMFRDSFGNALYPFFADAFGRAAFSRQMPYRLDWLERGQVDCLVVEIVERNLKNLAQKAPVMPAKRLTKEEADALGAPKALENAVQVHLEQDCPLAGYAMLSGTYESEGISVNSRVFLSTAAGIYEACPVGSGDADGCFTAYIPADLLQNRQISVMLQLNDSYGICDCPVE